MIRQLAQDYGNWENPAPMFAKWLLYLATVVFIIDLIAQGVRRAMNGTDDGYVDD